MANENPIHGREFDALYRKIFDTIVRAPEVKSELLALLKRGKLTSQTVFVLMARMDDLLQTIMKMEVEAAEATIQKTGIERRPHLLPTIKSQYIDGKKLSPTEVQFEEYCRRGFDEEEWLKDIGVTYP